MGKASVEQCSPFESSQKKHPYNMKPTDVSFEKGLLNNENLKNKCIKLLDE